MEAATPRQPERSDDELVRCVGSGSSAAFGELTARYYRLVCGYLYKRLGRPDLVEDLTQETFLEAYRALRGGREPGQFASWLFGIAANRLGKWFRRKRPRLFAGNEPPDVATVPFVSPQEELEEQQKLLTALEDGLAGLPAETRTLLHMKHHQGKTCGQIAAELGQPVGTIKSQLSRTYKLLRVRLRGSGGDNE